MDMTQYAGSESKYLKAADLQGRTPTVVIEAVHMVEFDDDEKGKVQKPTLQLRGKEKHLVANKTAVADLIAAFGPESSGWIGKSVRLSTKHYASFGKTGIVILPIIEQDFDDDIPF